MTDMNFYQFLYYFQSHKLFDKEAIKHWFDMRGITALLVVNNR